MVEAMTEIKKEETTNGGIVLPSVHIQYPEILPDKPSYTNIGYKNLGWSKGKKFLHLGDIPEDHYYKMIAMHGADYWKDRKNLIKFFNENPNFKPTIPK
jgi:hypothetical protein